VLAVSEAVSNSVEHGTGANGRAGRPGVVEVVVEVVPEVSKLAPDTDGHATSRSPCVTMGSGGHTPGCGATAATGFRS
jgi:hypothetical protein